jgi:cystathionine beta-lyase/cystathionine gamma-synthase
MTGFGAVLAFEVADAPTADRLCHDLHVIVHATSLGGVESTIERRSKLAGVDVLATADDHVLEPRRSGNSRAQGLGGPCTAARC